MLQRIEIGVILVDFNKGSALFDILEYAKDRQQTTISVQEFLKTKRDELDREIMKCDLKSLKEWNFKINT